MGKITWLSVTLREIFSKYFPHFIQNIFYLPADQALHTAPAGRGGPEEFLNTGEGGAGDPEVRDWNSYEGSGRGQGGSETAGQGLLDSGETLLSTLETATLGAHVEGALRSKQVSSEVSSLTGRRNIGPPD